MKQLTEYDRLVIYLDKISDLIRTELFESALEKPVITLQKTTGAYGHFETLPMWKTADGLERYEINLGSETITRPIECTVATLIHEYTHYYCHMNGIKDVSRNGYYHNKRFKAEAEKHMIKIDHADGIGFSITSPTDELIQWCIDHDLQEIKLGRGRDFFSLFGISKGTGEGPEIEKKTRKPSSTIVYYCPECGAKIRATCDKDNQIVCFPCSTEKTVFYIRKP